MEKFTFLLLSEAETQQKVKFSCIFSSRSLNSSYAKHRLKVVKAERRTKKIIISSEPYLILELHGDSVNRIYGTCDERKRQARRRVEAG